MSDTFRCSLRSEADQEGLAGTAPTEGRWVFVEQPGPWGAQALSGSRMPAEVAAALDALPARVQLIRHGSVPRVSAPAGVRVLVAAADRAGASVRGVVLDDVRELLDLDLDLDVELGPDPTVLTPYADPLWLVCANGRRDVCCAERGRPVAGALGAAEGAGVWETTHLGGHRFAATALHLPTGLLLGRLDPAAALGADAELAAGRWPVEHVRGRIGVPLVAQYAEVWLRREHDWRGLDDVALRRVGGDGEEGVVEFATPDGPMRLTVSVTDGPRRPVSCPGTTLKATVAMRVLEAVAAP